MACLRFDEQMGELREDERFPFSCLWTHSSAQQNSFFFNIYLFIYLAVPGLSCSTQDLFQLQHVESLVVAHGLLVVACGIQFPDQGWNPGSLHWEREVLATGPPGKSPAEFISVLIFPKSLQDGCLSLFPQHFVETS